MARPVGSLDRQPARATTPAAGAALDPDTRRFFEPRFGHDFSKVRIHADSAANKSAQRLGARAYTVGSDIYFRAGEYRPGFPATRRLLGHELAHVVQQDPSPAAVSARRSAPGLSRAPHGSVQPKLVATGDTARFISLANSLIAVQHELAISAKGEVSLRSSNIQGPPTQAAQELVSVLRTVINDPGTTTVRFATGAARVTVGSYLLSTVDLGDISAFGPAGARGLNARRRWRTSSLSSTASRSTPRTSPRPTPPGSRPRPGPPARPSHRETSSRSTPPRPRSRTSTPTRTARGKR
jgi:hypothetical protein